MPFATSIFIDVFCCVADKFNIAWLRGGHPILNVGDLSVEASKNLALLLDQLRYPAVKSLSNMVVIVLIKRYLIFSIHEFAMLLSLSVYSNVILYSLSAIAKERPAFYGRILPVLLGLDPSNSAVKVGHVSGVHHALKNAFLSCLKCTHPGAVPVTFLICFMWLSSLYIHKKFC